MKTKEIVKEVRHTRKNRARGEGVSIATKQLDMRFYGGEYVLVLYPDGGVAFGNVSRGGETIYIKGINFPKGRRKPSVKRPVVYSAAVVRLGGVYGS